MLMFAMACAALARQIHPDIDTPAPPDVYQLLAHSLFIQNLVSVEALSTGVWYVAIDLQLSVLFLGLIVTCSALSAKGGALRPLLSIQYVEVAIWALMIVALFWFNRWPKLDVWAIYFFGSFGMGAAASLRLHQSQRMTVRASVIFLGLLLSIVVIAMRFEWRPGVVVAVITTALLWCAHVKLKGTPKKLTPHKLSIFARSLRQLSGDSYALFLFHYPVVLLIGTITDHYWPMQSAPAIMGLMVSWGISMLIAFWVTRATLQKNALVSSQISTKD